MIGADAERARRPLVPGARREERRRDGQEHDPEDEPPAHREAPATPQTGRGAGPISDRRRTASPGHGSENTVSTPPRFVYSASFLYAPTAPSPSVSPSRPAARPIPAHPPTPERTATYCLPSGPT